MKRYFCLLLILAMVAVPFAACAKNDGDGEVSGGSLQGIESGEKGDTLEIPSNAAEAYKGKQFNIMYEQAQGYNYYPMYFEDPPKDDFYAMALHKRNLAVQDTLGISIVGKQYTGSKEVGDAFQIDVDGDNGEFQACFNQMTNSMSQVTSGRVVSYDYLKYVKLDKSWWNKDCTEQLAINGKSYVAAGDIMISDKEDIWALYFIKERIKDKELESPYDLVNNNQWTWEKMYSMADIAHADSDGNDVMVANSNDVFGLCTHGENFAASWESAGIKSITMTNGIPTLSWGSETFIKVWEEAFDEMNNKMVVSPRDINYITTAIMKNQTLFGTEVMAFVRTYRDSDTPFGIVPYPKYDSSVDRWYSYIAINSAVVTVGIANREFDYTSVVLETMAAYGQRDVLPVYYDQQLKSRYATDEESSAMLDIIFEYRCYDLGLFLSTEYTGLGTLTGNDVTTSKSQGPSRIWTAGGKRYQNQLDLMLDKLING